ncbi:M57 family metalloprotease [Paraflavisolibacter sp. H34]|uniref:M57 family metalloprotease n=1 Tax=Huijunlia imazamoxiresistens TaxID=3127457 RepID=UPI00301B6A79
MEHRMFFTVKIIPALAVLFLSCRKQEVPQTAAVPETHNIPALRRYLSGAIGAPPDSVVYDPQERQFVLEGDGCVSLEDALLRFPEEGAASGVNTTAQQEHYFRVVPARANNINLYADATVPAAWLAALDSAIASWNRTGSGVYMRRLRRPAGATTRVSSNASSSSTIASADYPDYYGNPGRRITINTRYNGLEATKKRFAMTHELGHTIGLAHTNSNWGYNISGTPAKDGASVMNATVRGWSRFTAYDLKAVRTLYPRR